MGNSFQDYEIRRQLTLGLIVCIFGVVLAFILVYSASQTLLVVGVGFLLVIFLAAPSRILLLYLATFPLLDQMIPFFTTQVSDLRFGPQILFRGGLVVLLPFYWLSSRRNPLDSRSALPMFILLALFCVNTLSSGDMLRFGIPRLSKIAFWIFLLITVADMVAQGKIRIEAIYSHVAFSTFIFVASLIISDVVGIQVSTNYEQWSANTGAFTPHSLALCLSMGLIAVLGLAIEQRNAASFLFLALLIATIILSIIRTYVRTAYVGLSGMLLIFNLLLWRYRKHNDARRYGLSSMGVVAVIVGVIILFVLLNVSAFEKRFGDFSDSRSIGAGRIGLYKVGLTMYSDLSIFGKIFGRGLATSVSYFGKSYSTHNDYLSIMLWGGAVGMGLYLWSFISLYSEVKFSSQAKPLPFIVAASTIAVYLLSGMTNNVMEYASVMTYFSFLVGGAMGYYRKTEAVYQE